MGEKYKFHPICHNKISREHFFRSRFQAMVSNACTYLQDFVLHLPPMPCSSPTRLPSFSFFPFHFCRTYLALGIGHFIRPTPFTWILKAPFVFASKEVQKRFGSNAFCCDCPQSCGHAAISQQIKGAEQFLEARKHATPQMPGPASSDRRSKMHHHCRMAYFCRICVCRVELL